MPEAEESRGGAPSLVQSFCIEGLYGYRTISLSSPHAASVLIAPNGAGKTTLLGALDAFLRGHLSRLRDLPFLRLRCRLRAVQTELILERTDVIAYLDIKPDSEIYREARRIEIDPFVFFNFITEQFGVLSTTDLRQLSENETYSALMRRFDYRRADTSAFCERLKFSLTEHHPSIRFILKSLESALANIDIVYLPTYRRIELPWAGPPDRHGRRKRPGFRMPQAGLYPGDIQFGLSDIADRLSDLNQNILIDSNQGYREISASIINELIDGTFDRGNPTVEEIPDREELELFFSRLKQGRRVGPYMDLSIPNIDKIYRGEDISVSGPTNKFLRYFLAKLNAVIGTTRHIEKTVNDFIESCNSYLATEDESVALSKGRFPDNSDGKALRLNRSDLKVHVESISSQRKISLDALSSGEKQMISLFARLLLYPRQKIILIDEPELSLSMDWQRRILVDIVNSPLCGQVVAITHSPFVFDNVLEPFAGALSVTIDAESEAELPDEDDLHGE